ncbi:unnamed protein product [Spirodela intermedia]|uniref:Peptidase A1 domain-containing protein n=1 Tax=Spirodela intermedia TaxID=51605 RepID=A0A7I8JL67_SPIIN|nr:unnamed protein product [Spirodela intermedia]CAA6670810.1 unnamed protein product [Spirodela intermedia]
MALSLSIYIYKCVYSYARVSGTVSSNKRTIDQSGVSIPAQSGAYLGTGNYVITIGLGTPTRAQTVVINAGSVVCWVHVRYLDGTSTVGFLSSDTRTLTPAYAFQNFIFGCGINNGGLLEGVAGLMGLGRGSYSRCYRPLSASTTSSTVSPTESVLQAS